VLVKNNSKSPIRIRNIVIKPGGVEDVHEGYLYTPRIQRFREKKRLIFPYCEREKEKQDNEVVVESDAVLVTESDGDE
jgi:hypothetical protein